MSSQKMPHNVLRLAAGPVSDRRRLLKVVKLSDVVQVGRTRIFYEAALLALVPANKCSA